MIDTKPPKQVWLTHRPGQHHMARTGSNDPQGVRYVLWDEHAELLEYANRMTARGTKDPISVLVELRFALGDDGKRSVPELIEFARGLAPAKPGGGGRG